MNVAVIGASRNPESYSHMAVLKLVDHGHLVFPVNPSGGKTAGVNTYTRVEDIPSPIDTVTLYVNKSISSALAGAICLLKPRRIIFNPGSENPELERMAIAEGITTFHGCTLVMLNTGQF